MHQPGPQGTSELPVVDPSEYERQQNEAHAQQMALRVTQMDTTNDELATSYEIPMVKADSRLNDGSSIPLQSESSFAGMNGRYASGNDTDQRLAEMFAQAQNPSQNIG